MKITWRKFVEAGELFEAGDDAGCLRLLQHILEDWNISNYLRTRALLMYAGVIDDWHKAETARIEAENLWQNARRLYPLHVEPATDKLLAEIRPLLDELAEIQIEEMPAKSTLGNEHVDLATVNLFDEDIDRDDEDVLLAADRLKAQQEAGNPYKSAAEREKAETVLADIEKRINQRKPSKRPH